MARQSNILSSRDLQIVKDNLAGILIARAYVSTFVLAFVFNTTIHTSLRSLVHVNYFAVMLAKGGRCLG